MVTKVPWNESPVQKNVNEVTDYMCDKNQILNKHQINKILMNTAWLNESPQDTCKNTVIFIH